MIMSFDLDGVIADTDRWFFRGLNVMYRVSLAVEGTPNDELYSMELDYYASRPLKHDPRFLMAEADEGVIITARKPWAKKVTNQWLTRYGIELPVHYCDSQDDINWDNYERASVIAGRYKAAVIRGLWDGKGVDVHFDNNPYVVQVMREELPGVTIIQVGGETI